MKRFMSLLVAVVFGLVSAASLCAKEQAGAGGTFVGEVVKKDGAKITVEGGGKTMTFVPHWRGGMPKDGGGFDKGMVEQLRKIERGDRVQIKWVFLEHNRVEEIKKLGGGSDEPKKERGEK